MQKVNKGKVFSRQTYMFEEDFLERTITIFWCWFVWSNLAINFVRTWFNNIILIDPENVAEENLINQNFTITDLKKSKSKSLEKKIEKEIPYEIFIESFKTTLEKFIKKFKTFDSDILIISTDNIESRKNFIKYYKENFKSLKNSIIVFINTSSDIISISITKWNEKFVNNIDDFYKNLKNEDVSVWLCWEKSAYFLWSLISWIVISEIKNYFQDFNWLTKEFIYLNKVWKLEEIKQFW